MNNKFKIGQLVQIKNNDSFWEVMDHIYSANGSDEIFYNLRAQNRDYIIKANMVHEKDIDEVK